MDHRIGPLRGEDEKLQYTFRTGSAALAISLAVVVVLAELATITWIRKRYMETPVLSAAVQVGLGSALVFLTGVLIGNS